MNQSNQRRQIIFDTETTGMNTSGGAPEIGHRVIEIGCVEMIDRKLTGHTFHVYINPEQEIDPEAIEVHGITNARVADEPLFAAVADDFLAFIQDAELIAHNASFDIGFLDQELRLAGYSETLAALCKVTDTLKIAKSRFPGQKNNLDALCKRYAIDNSQRTLHGALLDSEILADVYLMMTGGQIELDWAHHSAEKDRQGFERLKKPVHSQVIMASADEVEKHEEYLAKMVSKGTCIWHER